LQGSKKQVKGKIKVKGKGKEKEKDNKKQSKQGSDGDVKSSFEKKVQKKK
jgi:hypothetical protein